LKKIEKKLIKQQQSQTQTQEEISIKDNRETQTKSDLNNYLENINLQYVTKEIKKVTPLIDIPQTDKLSIISTIFVNQKLNMVIN
jgi:hypothetical protein